MPFNANNQDLFTIFDTANIYIYERDYPSFKYIELTRYNSGIMQVT